MKIIWLVNLAILCSFIKVFEIPSMIPIFVEELDFSYSQAGMFMAAYAFIKCLASLPGGSITDKWGGGTCHCSLSLFYRYIRVPRNIRFKL